jgi:hypothetical protein
MTGTLNDKLGKVVVAWLPGSLHLNPTNFLGAVHKAPMNCQKAKMPALQTVLLALHLSTSGNDPVIVQDSMFKKSRT